MKLENNQGNLAVIRINLNCINDLFKAIDLLKPFEDSINNSDIYPAYRLLLNPIYSSFSLNLSFNIIKDLEKILSDVIKNQDNYINNQYKDKIKEIKLLALKLEYFLKNELPTQPTYLVTSKEAYNISILIETPEKAFPGLIEKVSDTIYDIKECGKAMAFEMPNACAYHLMRILERVVRKYCILLNITTEENITKTLGVMIGNLEKNDKEKKLKNHNLQNKRKLTCALKDIKDLYRNPIIHPETNLEIDEAIILFNTITNVIKLILKEFPEEIKSK